MSKGNQDNSVMHPKSWAELLDRIRARPGMYLGSANLQALRNFMGGFNVAEEIHAVPELRRQGFNNFPWGKFESYADQYHNENRLSLRSFGLAQYEAQGKNIDTFDASAEYPGAWEIWWRWIDDFTARWTSC